MIIDKPGVYDLTAEEYFADPVPGGSLSKSGAIKLLPPSCPAKYKYAADHPDDEEHRDHLDFGAAAHRQVLSAGADIVVVDADSWRTKAAREERDQAHADGKIPILAKDAAIVDAMAAVLAEHPVAAALLSTLTGRAEQSLFAIDQATGVWLRGRFDVLRDGVSAGGRLLIPDYKTADSADREKFERSAYDHGYVQQAPWYVDLAKAVGLAGDAVMLFVVQEKRPPYLVNVIELSAIALDYGRILNRRAIDLYARCRETDRWPGYGDDIDMISLPPWVERKYLEEK